MAEIKNEFSWSNSRENVFKECKRKYFFQYYGYWGGWQAMAPREIRDVYVLKQLKTRFMWIGGVIHDGVAEALRSIKRGMKVPYETLVGLLRNRMRTEWQNSKDRRYWLTPKSCGLMEHEYEQNLSKEKWQELWSQVEACLKNFYGSPLLSQIEHVGPAAWKSIEEMKHFFARDVKVFAVLDFVFTDSDGKLVIVDWKTGKSKDSGNPWQLSIYGLFAQREWNVDPANVSTIEYNLVHNEGKESALSQKDMEETERHILESASAMRALLQDPKNNVALKDMFSPIEYGETCRSCNFQRICYPEKHAKSYTF